MAYAKDPEVILAQAKAKDITFWTVFDADGRSVLDEQNNDEMSLDDSHTKLAMLLNSIEGTVKVVLRETSKKTRAAGGDPKGTYTYSIRLGGNSIAGFSGAGANVISLLRELNQKEIEKITASYENEKQIRELKEKMESGGGAAEKLLERYAPLLEPLLGKLLASIVPAARPAASVAGLEEPAAVTHDQEILKSINDSIGRLMSVDPDFPKHLALLADFAQKDPAKYKMFIPMLNNL